MMNRNTEGASDGTLRWEELIANVPKAVAPRYTMTRANEPVLLYRGPLTIEFGQGIRIPDATLTWDWRREPIIHCSIDPTDDQRMTGDAFDVLCKPHKLVLEAIGTATWAVMHESHSCGSIHREKLQIVRPIVIGKLGPVTKAILHLVNCHDRSEDPVQTVGGGYSGNARLKLIGKGWQILIDKVSNHDNLVRDLNKSGGQAITHVMQVTRLDQAKFEYDRLNEILLQVNDFLAFATGSKPQMCLVAGFGDHSEPIWEIWDACAPSHWAPLSNWTSHHIADHVSRAFPGFIAKLNDPDWDEAISLASDWYVQAKHRGLETALVLGQAALELLASSAFEYCATKPCSEKDWESKKWPASSRIRWLLQTRGIDVSLPPLLTKLRAYRFPDGKQFEDGPHALTELRNAIAHPKKQKRARFGPGVAELRHEAATMALFFLEHVLLAIIGFDGIATAEATHGCLINYGLPMSP